MTDAPRSPDAERAVPTVRPGTALPGAGDLALATDVLRPLLRDPEWLDTARTAVATDPATLPRLFALAGRRAGRGPLHPSVDPTGVTHGTVDDAARAALVVARADAAGPGAPGLANTLTTLYHQGDTAERRGVLRALDALTVRGPAPTAAVPLAEDALRANDTSLVAAAVGPFGGRHLDDHTWRHAVLKLVFLGVPLQAVAGLDERADAELSRMAHDLAAERQAAGRDIPPDLTRLLRTTKE
ncbi:EboA domain-containing protein [Myceligenerans salitolerans]|uniref:EboA domain-containing protein n=1 Tax=Myceligenerans salitolerans TaxID=1230528 RepID=A0ABS3I569_9MICO|nr:EboA domain-containing protein [Myceligenerans salitolerans]MBO0607514.1 EboA domain-containing protein [Myceligenerans salitolerans]